MTMQTPTQHTKGYMMNYTPEGPEFILPTPKQWFSIIFMTFWLIGWAIAEYTVLRKIVTGDYCFKSPLVLWLILWTIGGGIALTFLLWMLFGTEHILIHPTNLTIVRKLLFFKRTRHFEIVDIRNLRVEEPQNEQYPGSIRRTQIIVFEYRGKTYRFGNGIDATSASEIVAHLHSYYRFPS